MEPSPEMISQVMRALQARRRRQLARCVVCDAPIPNATARRLYCSRACQQRAFRQRRRPGERPDPRRSRRTAAGEG